MTTVRRVLLIENDEHISRAITRALAHAHYDVTVAEDVDTAIALAPGRQHDLVMLDLYLAEQTEYRDIARLRQEPTLCHLPLMGLLAAGEQEARRLAPTLGIDYLVPLSCSFVDLAVDVYTIFSLLDTQTEPKDAMFRVVYTAGRPVAAVSPARNNVHRMTAPTPPPVASTGANTGNRQGVISMIDPEIVNCSLRNGEPCAGNPTSTQMGSSGQEIDALRLTLIQAQSVVEHLQRLIRTLERNIA